jgi:hypothetical protein
VSKVSRSQRPRTYEKVNSPFDWRTDGKDSNLRVHGGTLGHEGTEGSRSQFGVLLDRRDCVYGEEVSVFPP